ncbi:TPA: JAB domain-containing protein [Proteus mirabilis]|nr:DNA repair protein [Proteus mirabilis]
MTSTEHLLIERARKLLRAVVRKGKQLTSPNDVRDFLLFTLALRGNEVFGVVLLDNQNRGQVWCELFYGSVNETHIYPREAVKLAPQYNAAAIILVHNHPSGSMEVNSSDRHIAKKLKQALELIDVRVLDHFIVAGDSSISKAE